MPVTSAPISSRLARWSTRWPPATFAFRRDSVADTLVGGPSRRAAAHRASSIHESRRPLRWIVEQCLAKDATERYAATDDLARELRRVRDRLLGSARRAQSRPTAASPTGAMANVGARDCGAAARRRSPSVPGLLVARPMPRRRRFVPFASASAYEGAPAWSADGQTLAYVADVDGVLQVFVKRVRRRGQSSGHAGPIRLRSHPFWAPNGQLLYFISLAGDREALWSVSVAGGRPELVLENVVRAAIDPEGKRLAVLRNDPLSPNRAKPVVVIASGI